MRVYTLPFFFAKFVILEFCYSAQFWQFHNALCLEENSVTSRTTGVTYEVCKQSCEGETTCVGFEHFADTKECAIGSKLAKTITYDDATTGQTCDVLKNAPVDRPYITFKDRECKGEVMVAWFPVTGIDDVPSTGTWKAELDDANYTGLDDPNEQVLADAKVNCKELCDSFDECAGYSVRGLVLNEGVYSAGVRSLKCWLYRNTLTTIRKRAGYSCVVRLSDCFNDDTGDACKESGELSEFLPFQSEGKCVLPAEPYEWGADGTTKGMIMDEYPEASPRNCLRICEKLGPQLCGGFFHLVGEEGESDSCNFVSTGYVFETAEGNTPVEYFSAENDFTKGICYQRGEILQDGSEEGQDEDEGTDEITAAATTTSTTTTTLSPCAPSSDPASGTKSCPSNIPHGGSCTPSCAVGEVLTFSGAVMTCNDGVYSPVATCALLSESENTRYSGGLDIPMVDCGDDGVVEARKAEALELITNLNGLSEYEGTGAISCPDTTCSAGEGSLTCTVAYDVGTAFGDVEDAFLNVLERGASGLNGVAWVQADSVAISVDAFSVVGPEAPMLERDFVMRYSDNLTVDMEALFLSEVKKALVDILNEKYAVSTTSVEFLPKDPSLGFTDAQWCQERAGCVKEFSLKISSENMLHMTKEQRMLEMEGYFSRNLYQDVQDWMMDNSVNKGLRHLIFRWSFGVLEPSAYRGARDFATLWNAGRESQAPVVKREREFVGGDTASAAQRRGLFSMLMYFAV